MTFNQARREAASMKDGCVHHVQAKIARRKSASEQPKLDDNGYHISDWCDSNTVSTFVNGKELGEGWYF